MAKRVKKIKKKNPMQTAFTRFMLIVAFFIIWIGGIGVRLVHLQINQYEALRAKALDQRRDTVKEKQLRGTIYDRTERALAMSVKAKSLFVDPAEIENTDQAAKEIAKALKVKPDELGKNLREAKQSGKRFVWLARKLDEDSAEKINRALENKELKKTDLPRYAGLHWKEEQKRSYPYKTLAAQVIGFSNADDVGSAGIEQSQEQSLRGAVLKGWQDRDRLGRVYDESEIEREPPHDVILTISHSIQYKTELALEQGVKNSGAKSGMAIVMVPQTGEILAMANYPTFDPNNYTAYAAENYINNAVHDSYSPGSVFKLITYSAATNEGAINPGGEVDCGGGVLQIPGRKISDRHCLQTISYPEAMAVSSNIAAMKTAFAVGKDNFYEYVRKFGFGAPTGIELPGETGGILRAPKSWSGDSLASMSIGYEIGVSALQMATSFATIANDGYRIQPHIIKEIRSADGKVSSATEPQRTQVVTADTARALRQMLREVVLTGTGKRAQLNGYTSAGKTGTAWKYNPKLKRVDASKYVSSFIGMAPAENPSVVIAVVMDEPSSGARDGGQVSAPVFREIAEQILPEMNVVPDAGIRQETLTAQELPAEIEPSAVPTAEDAVNDPRPASEKSDKKSVESDRRKESRPAKKAEKKMPPPPAGDQKGTRPKTAALIGRKAAADARDRLAATSAAAQAAAFKPSAGRDGPRPPARKLSEVRIDRKT
jgi:cell division protein FtsI (penicillin-binding protein 3)